MQRQSLAVLRDIRLTIFIDATAIVGSHSLKNRDILVEPPTDAHAVFDGRIVVQRKDTSVNRGGLLDTIDEGHAILHRNHNIVGIDLLIRTVIPINDLQVIFLCHGLHIEQ